MQFRRGVTSNRKMNENFKSHADFFVVGTTLHLVFPVIVIVILAMFIF